MHKCRRLILVENLFGAASVVVIIIFLSLLGSAVLSALYLSGFGSEGALATAKLINSNGFLGVCAIGAALIAFLGVRRQVAAQDQWNRRDRWWARYEWVADRELQSNRQKAVIPADVSVTHLTALLSDSEDDSQKAAVRGVLDLALARDRDGHDKDGKFSGPMEEALQGYINVAERVNAPIPKRLQETDFIDRTERLLADEATRLFGGEIEITKLMRVDNKRFADLAIISRKGLVIVEFKSKPFSVSSRGEALDLMRRAGASAVLLLSPYEAVVIQDAGEEIFKSTSSCGDGLRVGTTGNCPKWDNWLREALQGSLRAAISTIQ